MDVDTLKKTPLYNWHQSNGGKVVDFAGWALPVQYEGVIAEHRAVRESCGIFDVSHMGEIFVTGPEAEKALDYLTCNTVLNLQDGRAQYSAILNERGGVVDDVIIYRFSKTRYLLCVNASNCAKDFEWLLRNNTFQAEFVNQSAEFGQIALQGPKAQEVFTRVCDDPRAQNLEYFSFCESTIGNYKVIVARTGYTGEDGYEIFVPWDSSEKIWQFLIEQGAPLGLKPCGLGARDSLRLEACFPLHGHELGDEISALESGLGWIVKFEKGDFLGRAALKQQKERGLERSLVGFFVDDPGITRHADRVLDQAGIEIGTVTSGTKTPTLNRALGLALVKKEHAAIGSPLVFDVRGRSLKGRVVKRPFYSALKR